MRFRNEPDGLSFVGDFHKIAVESLVHKLKQVFPEL